MNQFGDRLKELREQENLLQRHIAHKLKIDNPIFRKIEREVCKAKREQVSIIKTALEAEKYDLLSLWLADQVYDGGKMRKWL